jgi:WD40 repeat protein
MRRSSMWDSLACAIALGAMLLGFSAFAQQQKGDIGARFITVTPELAKQRSLLLPFGALVTVVTEGGAAAKADVTAGDVVQVINDHQVQRAEDVQAVLDALSPGDEVRVTLLHAGQITQAKMTLQAPSEHVQHSADAGDPMLMLDTGGHMATIKSVIFTRDGRQIVSASDDKVIRIWDWRTGKTVRTIRGELGAGINGQVYAVALSPNERWLAVGGYFDKDPAYIPCCGAIRIYDFATGRLVRLLKGHINSVFGLAFSSDSRRLISGSFDTTAIIWDVDSGQLLQHLVGHKDHIYAVGFSPDGERAITGSLDSTLRIWRTSDGKLLAEMAGHSNRIRSLAIRGADGLIATGDQAGNIQLWNGQTGQFLVTLANEQTEVGALAFSPDGNRLLSTSGYPFSGKGSYTQYVWDVATGAKVVTFTHNTNTVFAAAISADGKFAATGGGNNDEIQLWNFATGQSILGPDHRPLVLGGTGTATWAVGFSADGKRMAWGNTFKYTGPDDRGPLQFQMRLPGPGENLGAPEPLAAGDATQFIRGSTAQGNVNLAARAGHGYNDGILDVQIGGKVIASLERGPATGYQNRSYAVTSDGQTIISGGNNGRLDSYDVAEFTAKGGLLTGGDVVRHPFVGHESEIWGLTPSPDGRYLVSGSNDQTVRLWNLKTRELIVTLFRGDDGEWAMWTPQGYYAASPNGEALVGWNLNRGMDKEAQWVTVEQLRRVFYRPDVVAKAIAMASAEGALKEAGLNLRAADLLSKPLPVIRTVWPLSGTSLPGPRGIITVAVKKSDAPPTSWQFRVGGVIDNPATEVTVSATPVAPPAGHPAIGEDENLYAFEIPLRKGQNVVKVVARNVNGPSLTQEQGMFVDGDGDLDARGTLHILAVGVDKYPTAQPLPDLSYAGRDAKDFAQTAASAMKGRNKSVEIETLCQVDGCTAPPTLQNILAALERIATADEHDTVVVFLSGHGESSGGKYFFLPTDFQRSGADVRNSVNALDWERVEDALGRARGSKLLFVDACHSGAAFNASLLNDSRQKGVIAFSSAAPNEVAWEDPQVKHGLFTYWLIRGLSGEAEDSEHTVTVYRLGAFLAEKVPEYAVRRRLTRQDPIFASLLDSNPAIAWP